MTKKLVVTFPGIRGTEIPLLYFCSKYYEDQGYEKLFIQPPAGGEPDFETILHNAMKQLEGVEWSEYKKVVFIGKSMGTIVAGTIKEKLSISASLVLLTPLEATFPFIRQGNGILLVAMGDQDRYMSAEPVQELCEREQVPFYLERGVGHRMEIPQDLTRNLQIIRNVVETLRSQAYSV